MLAELFQKIVERLDTRHVSRFETITDPKDGGKVTGYFDATGVWRQIHRQDPQTFKFPKVNVFSADSLIAYARYHAEGAIDENRSILRVNKGGLALTIDYGCDEDAQERSHTVSFPAVFDEECEVAAAAITGALGKWIDLDNFDTMLDKCAPFVPNFSAIYEATSNLEGHESAKILKTAASFQIVMTGEVSGTANMPKEMKVHLLFMGVPIQADIPIRLKVENKQIAFHLVDNGALAKARADAMRRIKAQVVEALPRLLVIDGSLMS